MWHTPDEQAHFAQVAYFAEFNRMPKRGFDLNREIWQSEKLLGTDRDQKGNNKFTFHPEYRIEYTNSLIGRYEKDIQNLPLPVRQEMVKQESANYPPLYYWIAAIPYKLFYSTDLINRIFLSRFVSIIFGILTVFLSWLIAKELFPKKRLYQITLPVLVSFQPMLSFVFAGITSDNLLNLMFSLIIYLSLLLISQGISKKLLLFALLSLFLTYLTKPQFVLAIPILLLAIIFSVFINHQVGKKLKIGLSLNAILGLVGIYFLITQTHVLNILESLYSQGFNPGGNQVINITPWQFFKETLLHTYKEVIPWYWGVFDWLSVTYPRGIHRVINWLMVIAGVGVVIRVSQILRKRTKEDLLFIFMIMVALTYFLGITYYNYLFTLSHAFPFGIQGRYYFPVIIAHMAALLIGLSAIIPNRFKKIKNCWVKVLGLGMILLNFIALWIIVGTYYDISNINNFIVQASQYKPWFYKGYGLILIFIIYLFLLIIFLSKYLILKESERTRSD
jgi:4-amino-4-deoxy-L-arabinose transferase-like glycosyltransferase